MKRRLPHYIIATVTTLVFVGGIAAWILLRPVSPPPPIQDITPIHSMEHEGNLTKQDIDERDRLEAFAEAAVVRAMQEQYGPGARVVVVSREWYFTERNKHDNILVTVDIYTGKETKRTSRVTEVATDSTRELTIRSLYQPDERYTP